MAQSHEGRTRTFTAGAALGQHLRVRLSAGKLAAAGLADTDSVGTLSRATFADGDAVAVVLRNAPGTQVMVADGVIAAGAKAYSAAGGKVSATATGAVEVGIALEAAAANGDWIEILPTNI